MTTIRRRARVTTPQSTTSSVMSTVTPTAGQWEGPSSGEPIHGGAFSSGSGADCDP